MFALKLDFLDFASIEGKSSKKPSIELKGQTDQEHSESFLYVL